MIGERIVCLLLGVCLTSHSACVSAAAVAAPRPTTASVFPQAHEFKLLEDSPPRSDVFLPLGSYFLPGLGQWVHGQHAYAAAYSGFALLGLEVGAAETARLAKEKRKRLSEEDVGPRRPVFADPERRAAGLAFQVYSLMGGLSAYHSFRSAVHSRRPHHQYTFLTKEESIKDLALAPFDFHHLKQKSTWIPLAALAGLQLLIAANGEQEFTGRKLADHLYTGAYSYNAGVGEEAFFRGWLMPVLREYSGSDLTANLGSSLVFALAHVSPQLPLPIVQGLLGSYLGYISQQNQWQLGESIFLHAWWDVLALTGAYFQKKTPKEGAIARVYWLPALTLSF